MDVKGSVSLFRRAFDDWNKHNVTRFGAALAFYTIVSISPLMILVLAIVSLVFNKNAAQAQLLAKVQELLGMQGRETVNTLLVHGHTPGSWAPNIQRHLLCHCGRHRSLPGCVGCLPRTSLRPHQHLGVRDEGSVGAYAHAA